MSILDSTGFVSYTFNLTFSNVTGAPAYPPLAPISFCVDILPIYGFAPRLSVSGTIGSAVLSPES